MLRSLTSPPLDQSTPPRMSPWKGLLGMYALCCHGKKDGYFSDQATTHLLSPCTVRKAQRDYKAKQDALPNFRELTIL